MTTFNLVISQIKMAKPGLALDGFNVVAAYNLCDAATFLKTILGSYW